MSSWIEKNILSGKRPYFIIIGLAFVVYFPILFFGFTYLDDNSLILDHAGFLSNFLSVFEAFRQDVFLSLADAYYRPMMTVSLIMNAQIGGVSPFIYHLTDLLIHLLASSLVFVFFQKLKYRKDLSLLFSLIFAVHPVLTQAVAWIPGRNDTLLTVFILLAFISFVNFLEKKNGRYLKQYFLWFALAMFTKETAIMIIPLQWFYLHFVYPDKESYFSKADRMLAIGWASIIGIFFLMRHFAFQNPISFSLENIFKSLFKNSPAAIQFIGKIIFPFNLSTYPIIQDTTFIYGIIAILLVAIAIFFTKNKRYLFMLFGAIWFFFFLFPTFIRPNTDFAADFIEHRTYLPIIGFFLLLMETSLVQKFSYKKNSSLAIAAGIILLFVPLTMIRSQNFKDRLAFWNDAAKHSPHAPLARRNLGAMLYLDGNLDRAEPEFKKAIELNPKEQMAHNNLGLIYADRGEFEKAEKEFDLELEVNPFYDSAYANKGNLYYKMGLSEEAVSLWKEALKINPDYSSAVYNVFSYYYQKQDKENATYWARMAKERGMELLPEMKQLLDPFEYILNPGK